jgi:hypothetical protein
MIDLLRPLASSSSAVDKATRRQVCCRLDIIASMGGGGDKADSPAAASILARAHASRSIRSRAARVDVDEEARTREFALLVLDLGDLVQL